MNWMVVEGPFLIFGMFLILAALQIGGARYIEARFEHRKGFYNSKAGWLRPWRRSLLQILRAQHSLKYDLPSAFEFMFLSLAAAMLPTFDRILILDLPNSWWWFAVFLFCAPLSGLLLRWLLKTRENWMHSLGWGEHTLMGIGIIGLLSLFVTTLTGTDSLAKITQMQQDHGWLIFQKPESIPGFVLFLVLGIFLFSSHPFDNFVDEQGPTRWSLKDMIPVFQQTLWVQTVVTLFLGGMDGIPTIGTIFYILKCFIVWFLARVITAYFISVREDQGENFVIRFLVPGSLFSLVLVLFVAVFR